MTTQTILDLVVILLLVPTIVYAIILNRRLVALRRSRDELGRIVASFNDATMRAEAGIPKLKKATTEANQTLKDRVDKAQTLRDDLAFMVQRAEELANRLEAGVKAARVDVGTTPAAPVSAAASTYGAAAPAPVRGLAAEPPPRTLAAAAAPSALAETAAELRSALGAARAEAKVPGAAVGPAARGRRGAGAERNAPNEDVAIAEERSEAERELLKALQAAR